MCAAIAQLVERIHGKDEVSGSSPDRGSIEHNNSAFGAIFYLATLKTTLQNSKVQDTPTCF